MFVIAGAGIAAADEPVRVRHVDVAPTIATLLGLPPLPDADGRVLTELFERDEPPVPSTTTTSATSTTTTLASSTTTTTSTTIGAARPAACAATRHPDLHRLTWERGVARPPSRRDLTRARTRRTLHVPTPRFDATTWPFLPPVPPVTPPGGGSPPPGRGVSSTGRGHTGTSARHRARHRRDGRDQPWLTPPNE